MTNCLLSCSFATETFPQCRQWLEGLRWRLPNASVNSRTRDGIVPSRTDDETNETFTTATECWGGRGKRPTCTRWARRRWPMPLQETAAAAILTIAAVTKHGGKMPRRTWTLTGAAVQKTSPGARRYRAGSLIRRRLPPVAADPGVEFDGSGKGWWTKCQLISTITKLEERWDLSCNGDLLNVRIRFTRYS